MDIVIVNCGESTRRHRMKSNRPSKKRKIATEEVSAEGQQINTIAAVRLPHEAPVYVTELGENDILLGRGKPIINYIGNQRYRALVRTRKEEYAASPRTHTKETIAREILESISERKGRFLQLVPPELRDQDSQIPSHCKVWRVVDMDTAIAKIKQTLRDREYIRSAERQHDAELETTDGAVTSSSSLHQNLARPIQNDILAPPNLSQGLPPVTVNRHPMTYPNTGGGDSARLQLLLSRQRQQPSDLELLQQLQIMDRQRREADLRTQEIQFLIAQQQHQQAQVLRILGGEPSPIGTLPLQSTSLNPELAALQELIALQNLQQQRQYQLPDLYSIGGQNPSLGSTYHLNFSRGSSIPAQSSSLMQSANPSLLSQLLDSQGGTGLSMNSDFSTSPQLGTTRTGTSMAGGAQLESVAAVATAPITESEQIATTLSTRYLGNDLSGNPAPMKTEESDDEEK